MSRVERTSIPTLPTKIVQFSSLVEVLGSQKDLAGRVVSLGFTFRLFAAGWSGSEKARDNRLVLTPGRTWVGRFVSVTENQQQLFPYPRLGITFLRFRNTGIRTGTGSGGRYAKTSHAEGLEGIVRLWY